MKFCPMNTIQTIHIIHLLILTAKFYTQHYFFLVFACQLIIQVVEDYPTMTSRPSRLSPFKDSSLSSLLEPLLGSTTSESSTEDTKKYVEHQEQ